MRFWGFLILKLWVSCSNVISEETACRSERGREMIMGNLRRFHGGLDPLTLSTLDREYLPVKDLPDDVFIIIENYLCYPVDSNSLYSTCNYANQLRVNMINSRLAEFNRYYLFEEQWLNTLMYTIIKANFPVNMLLHSEGIHDHLELMTLKYIHRTYLEVHESIPRPLYHAILTFLHETVYGPGEIVPTNRYSWQKYFSYKITGFRLPLTADFFCGHFEENYYTKFYRFLLEPRSKQEKEQFIAATSLLNHLTRDFINFEWNFEGVLPEVEAKMLLEALADDQIYSEHILNRIQLTSDIDVFLIRMAKSPAPLLYPRHIYDQFRRYLYRKSEKMLYEPVYNCASYIKSRDLSNSFEPEVLASFKDFAPWTVLRLIVTLDLPHLIKMEILSKLVKSGLVPLNSIEPIASSRFKPILQKLAEDSLPFFERVLTDYPQLINLENLPFPLHLRLTEPRRYLIMTTQFPCNNPLALVKHMASDFPSKSFPNLTGKYNLNVKYYLDCDIKSFEDVRSGCLQNWLGKTLTFRQILRILNNKHISEAFGLISWEDFEENEDQMEMYPIIHWNSYLNDPNSIFR